MQTRCHLSVLVHQQAKKYGDRTVLTYHDFGNRVWKTMSWNTFSEKVSQVSNALLNIGVKVQENIGVFSQNSVQYLFTDFGAWGVRAVTVPFYATSSEQQIQYMVADAQIRILFVGEQEQYDKAYRAFPMCPTLERIIVFDHSVTISEHDPNTLYFDDFLALGKDCPRQAEVEKLYREADNNDLCNILYTSGTTGDSKGVMLTHGQYMAALKANDEAVPLREFDRVMNFLPYTHIFERGWTLLCLSEGLELIVNTYPKDIQDALRETHPNCMSSVPRFWEKVYAGVKDKIDNANPVERKLFKHTLAIGRKHNIEYLSRGKRPPLGLKMEYEVMNKTLFSMVRKQIGMENAYLFPTAGATVSPEVEEFVHSVGINMVVGYGLTESLATVSCDHTDGVYTIGSVGRLINGIEVKFGDNDEIMLKGPTITKGYYKREALNKEVFTEDGFFRTGDSGYIKDGELYLKERIKDLFKTSNGKYIAPQGIESKLVVDKYIDQIAVIADQRKFVAALIVPDYHLLEHYAKDHGIAYSSREDLCLNKAITEMMMERIDTLQQQLASYEKVKRFTLMPKAFTMESGELTNTLKIKRPVLNNKYADVIDRMYE